MKAVNHEINSFNNDMREILDLLLHHEVTGTFESRVWKNVRGSVRDSLDMMYPLRDDVEYQVIEEISKTFTILILGSLRNELFDYLYTNYNELMGMDYNVTLYLSHKSYPDSFLKFVISQTKEQLDVNR